MQAGEPKASDGPIMMATAKIRIMRTVIAKTSPRMRAKKRSPVWPVNNWPASDTDQTRTVGKNRLKSGAADCSRYRQAAGAFAEAVIRSVELIVQPGAQDGVGEMGVRGDWPRDALSPMVPGYSPRQAEAIKLTCISQNFNDRLAPRETVSR
jgi:hypothetical protein